MRQIPRMRDIGGLPTMLYDTGSPLPAGPPHASPPTLVMVHGGDVRSLSNAADWSTVWNPVTIGARLIAYDKPGQGQSYASGIAVERVTLPGLVAHLEALVEEVGSPVVLMGHSRGALPVAELALRRPELVSGLVLVSSNTLAPPSVATPSDFYKRAYADPPDELDDEYARREPEMNSFDPAHLELGLIDARRESALMSGWWADRAHRMRIYPEVEASLQAGRKEVLRRLEESGFGMPVLLIWGHDDVSAPRQLGDELGELLMSATGEVTAVRVNRAGHYVYREHPEVVMAHVAAFLESMTSASRAGPEMKPFPPTLDRHRRR